jgi:5'(3')-deoxyribonucleotidase
VITVGYDVDNTLAECDGPLVAEINRRLGTDLSPGEIDYYTGFLMDYVTPHVEDPAGFLADVWWGAGFLASLPPILPTIVSVHELVMHGVQDIRIITARQIEDRPWVKTETEAWLRRHVPFSELAFARDKAAYCRRERVSVLIEDAPQVALDCAKAGVRVYLIDRPYNRDTPDGATGVGRGRIVRVAHGREAVAHLLANPL